MKIILDFQRRVCKKKRKNFNKMCRAIKRSMFICFLIQNIIWVFFFLCVFLFIVARYAVVLYFSIWPSHCSRLQCILSTIPIVTHKSTQICRFMGQHLLRAYGLTLAVAFQRLYGPYLHLSQMDLHHLTLLCSPQRDN